MLPNQDDANPKVSRCVESFLVDLDGILTTRIVSLRLSSLGEGDPIRATGAKLPKGKLVKIQAQNLEFLEVSDPKAV